MNEHEKVLYKFKKLLKDIFNTEFCKFLKKNYIPKVLKFERDENGKIKKDETTGLYKGKATLVQTLPDKEVMIYAFSLMRQFILKKDDISIYKIGRHIKALGTENDYNYYKECLDKFEKYGSLLSGANYQRTDKNGIFIRKSYTRLELVNELFYGDIFHRDDDKFNVSQNLLSMNKIIEYFLQFLVYICRIATVIKFPDEDYSIYHKNCPEKILYGS